MELAGRVFDVVTKRDNVVDEVRRIIPEIDDSDGLRYWKRAVRMAALCHDIGHLPFSHAAEKDLLPADWNHERLTRELILSREMADIWDAMTPPLRALAVVKLAIGQKEAPDLEFSTWQTILSEIIVGDSFGVDRMDYLLRDSYHVGVPYGRFDHFRLIDTLRILPLAESGSGEPALGVEEGGLRSAEALLLGRYYMYSQVYFHPIRRIYDIHLKDFLSAWLPGHFSTDIESHLRRTDNEVLSAISIAALDPDLPGHDPARRIARHDHYKLLYQRYPDDVRKNPAFGAVLLSAAQEQFGSDAVRRDAYKQKRDATRFPVRLPDERIDFATSHSDVLSSLPVVTVDFLYIRPDLLDEARRWFEAGRKKLLKKRPKEE